MQTASENEVDEYRPDKNLRGWLEIGLIFAVFFILAGDPAPHVNEAHYLAKAKHYWNPTWIENDLFLDSADAHLTFYWTVGWLTKWFSLPTVAWMGRIAAWLLLAFAWQRLSRQVLNVPLTSVLAAALFVTLLARNNFAGEWVVGGVEGKCYAYALVFAGLAAICRSSWKLGWPLFGLASAFHVLVGGWSTIAAFYIWLREPRTERPSLVSMLPSLILGAVLSLPGVVPALQLTDGATQEVRNEANQIYVFDRLPHHLAPLSLPMVELQMKTIRFGKLVLIFFILWAICRLSKRNDRWPSAAENSYEQPSLGLVRVIRFAQASLLLCSFGAIWELATRNHPALSASILKYYWFRLVDVAIPLAVCFAIVWVLYRLIITRSKLATAGLLIAICYPAWHFYSISLERWQKPAAPAERRLRNPKAWLEACQWVQENTAKEAMFLVPRSSNTFKWNTGRRDLVIRKDIPQDAASLLVWSERYNEVFWYTDEFGENKLYRSLATQGADRMQQLAEKYSVDYVLTRDYPPLDLPVAYSNKSYTIYAMSSAAQAAHP